MTRLLQTCACLSKYHAQACVGSMPCERDPLQLAEHLGDAFGVMPAVTNLPSRCTLAVAQSLVQLLDHHLFLYN